MALRCAALIAVGSAVGASAGSVCTESTSPMIGYVTEISPECFKQCPQMCQPLDGLISEYMATGDTNAIKAKVCADQEPFACMFEGGHLAECGKVLSAGSGLGVTLPMSAAELQEQCSSSSLRGGGAKYNDINGTAPGGNNTDTPGDISAAVGRGVAGTAAARLVLGLLGSVALLCVAA